MHTKDFFQQLPSVFELFSTVKEFLRFFSVYFLTKLANVIQNFKSDQKIGEKFEEI